MADPILDAAELRKSLNHLTVNGKSVAVDLSLIEKIYDLNAEITRKFPAEWGSGIMQMGLILDRVWKHGGYWCTPINSVSFGGTGGDGAHFSFLVTNNRIDHTTPVIISVPDNFGEAIDANIVLGHGFEDFVRLGLHCGYFSMAQFAFDLDKNLAHYARTDWNDSDSWFPSKNHRIVAEYVAKELALKPLVYTKKEFVELQNRIKPFMAFNAAN